MGWKLTSNFIRPAQSAGTPLQYRSLLKSWLEGSFWNQPPPPYRKCWSRASFSPGASLGAAAAAGRALKPAAPIAASPAATRRKSRRPTPAAASRVASRSIWASEIGGCFMESSCWWLLHFWIESVAHAVAEEREGQHGDRDGDRREHAEMPVGADVLLALADHLAPRGRGRVDPDPDEGQGRLGEDRLRDAERHGHHDGRQRVGQHVTEEETSGARDEGARPLDVLPLLDSQNICQRLPRDDDPAVEPSIDTDGCEPVPALGHDEEHEQQAREGVHDVDEAGEEQVGAPADGAGQRADRHADRHHGQLGAEADQHR